MSEKEKQNIEPLKPYGSGVMKAIETQLAAGARLPKETLERYEFTKKQIDQMGAEPVIVGAEVRKENPRITPQDLADAAAVLGETQDLALPEDRLTEQEEIQLSTFKVKADSKNQMPSDTDVARERARIINNRAKGSDTSNTRTDLGLVKVDEIPRVEGEPVEFAPGDRPGARRAEPTTGTPPVDTGTPTPDPEPRTEDPRRDTRGARNEGRERTGETRNTRLTEASVLETAERYKSYEDPTLRARLLGRLAEDAGRQSLDPDVVNLISKMATEARTSIPHKDKFSTEIEVSEDEDKMLLRGTVIEMVGNSGSNMEVEGVYEKVKATFLARKGITFGVLPPEVEARVKMEIEARLELQKNSLFWNRMKDDKNPEADTYNSLKSGLGSMPLLSEGTYRWLMEESRDASYIYVDGKTGNKETVECKDLRAELDSALGKIYAYITSEEIKDPNTGEIIKPGGDLWLTMNYDQKVLLFDKLEIKNPNVATLALQLAEAECWTAMRPGSYHPARKLAYLSDYRMERLSKSLSVPGGYRLIQEYCDRNGGRLPFHRNAQNKVVIDDASVFDQELVSLARLGLDMDIRLRDFALNGKYLENLKSLYEMATEEGKVVRESQFNMRTDLSLSAGVFDAFEALGKPPVGLDVLGKLKGSLFPWYATRFGPSNLQAGVSGMMLEFSKTYLWTNSVANNIRNLDSTKIVDIKKYFEESFVPLVDAVDPLTNSGAYIGSSDLSVKRLVEERGSNVGPLPLSGFSVLKDVGSVVLVKQQIGELARWFEDLLYKKCYPILNSARLDSSLQAKIESLRGPSVPKYLLRADRNTPSMVKLRQDSFGFMENVRNRLRAITNDSGKWWNRR